MSDSNIIYSYRIAHEIHIVQVRAFVSRVAIKLVLSGYIGCTAIRSNKNDDGNDDYFYSKRGCSSHSKCIPLSDITVQLTVAPVI